MVIKMVDLAKQNRGTYNHPTSTKVAGILISKQDIIVETREGRL